MTEKQIKLDVNNLKDCIIIVKQGKLIEVDKPETGYGKVTIELDGNRIHKWNKETSYK